MPYWEQIPTTQMAQSSWAVLVRDTPYAGWEHFDPPVQVTTSGHFLPIPTRIRLGVLVFDKGLVVEGVCDDNQALGFFADLMKAMEDAWPRATDLRTAFSSSWQEHQDTFRAKLLENLVQHFGEDELRTLCFYLEVDYENLTAQGKDGKARDLIIHLERLERIPELMECCRKLRPMISWEDLPGTLRSTAPD
jgi:hypothetical protein